MYINYTPSYILIDIHLSKEVSSTIFKVFGIMRPEIEAGRPGFNPRSSHTKDFKNGIRYLLA